MPKDNFYAGGLSTRSDVSLEVDRITGVGGPEEYPRLFIPIDFTLRPFEDKGKIKAYSLLWLKSDLYVENMKMGEGVSELIAAYSSPYPNSRQVSIEIPLDLYRIEKIEERRKGDIQLRLSGSALIAVHPFVDRADHDERQEFRKDIEELNTGQFTIAFGIPQSHWVDKILPGLGYGKVKLIEVPIPEKIVPESYQKALKELQESEKYFVEGDYDKVVAHCRSALQLIPKVLPVDLSGIERPSFNDEVKKFLEEHLSPYLADSKREALETIIKATWKLSSIPHHPSPPGYFSRADSEAILQITTILLAYMGKLLK